MRKEIIFAIVIGALFGLAIVLGIRRVNNTPITQPADQSVESDTSVNIAENVDNKSSLDSLAIISPHHNDVLTDSDTTISGLAAADSWIVLLSQDDEQIAQASSIGEFSFNLELEGGINKFRLVNLSSNGQQSSEDLTIVYTSQIEE